MVTTVQKKGRHIGYRNSVGSLLNGFLRKFFDDYSIGCRREQLSLHADVFTMRLPYITIKFCHLLRVLAKLLAFLLSASLLEATVLRNFAPRME